jgi:hypothetical protein
MSRGRQCRNRQAVARRIVAVQRLLNSSVLFDGMHYRSAAVERAMLDCERAFALAEDGHGDYERAAHLAAVVAAMVHREQRVYDADPARWLKRREEVAAP